MLRFCLIFICLSSLVDYDFWELFGTASILKFIWGPKLVESGVWSFVKSLKMTFSGLRMVEATELLFVRENRYAHRRLVHALIFVLLLWYHLLPQLDSGLFQRNFELTQKVLIGVFAGLEINRTTECLSRPY
jgi:hypothetical protein